MVMTRISIKRNLFQTFNNTVHLCERERVHACLYVSPTVHLCALCSPLKLGVVVVSSVSANLHAIYVFICFCSSEHCE